MTYIDIKWPDVAVSITVDPVWDRELHNSGIREWLSGFPAKDKNSKTVKSFLTEIDRTTLCYGSEITPDYDKAGKTATLLKQLVGPGGGFLFTHQTYYTANGTRIIGVDGAPVTLGPK